MKKEKKYSNKLNRFTTLPVLLDLLRRKKLVLRDPSKWEDLNDVKVLDIYMKKRKKTGHKLFAMCFCKGAETIHHWKTYADGVLGCCIEFDRNKLVKCFSALPDVRYDDVDYKEIKAIESEVIELSKYPFIKRKPYQFEKEFRILWEGKTKLKSIDLDIDMNSINKITLSQSMPKELFTSAEKLLRTYINDLPIEINRSTLFENDKWIKAFKK